MMGMVLGTALAATTPEIGLSLSTTADRDVLLDASGAELAAEQRSHAVGRLELGATHRGSRSWFAGGRVGLPVLGAPAPFAFAAGGGRRVVETGLWVDVGVEVQLQHTVDAAWRQALVPAATGSVGRGAWSVVYRLGWAVPLQTSTGPAGPSWTRTQSAAPGLRAVDLALRYRPTLRSSR
jgi:hypothetical protein